MNIDVFFKIFTPGGMYGYTLLGLPNEDGEEMWSREIDVGCVINKTCSVRGRDNVVIVENYWMTMDESTEEDEASDDTDDIGE